MPHVDVLEQPESLGRSLFGSIALHIAVFGSAVILSLVGPSREYWGDRNAGGGSPMIVNVVGQVPLPSRGGDTLPARYPEIRHCYPSKFTVTAAVAGKEKRATPPDFHGRFGLFRIKRQCLNEGPLL